MGSLNNDFTRYADDTIILVKSEKAANRVMESITKYIENKLGLKVNMTKTKVCKPNDVKYLGFGFYKDYKNNKWECKAQNIAKVKFQSTLKHLTKRSESMTLDKRFERLNWAIRGWVNYFRIGKMKYFLSQADAKLRTRIRMIIWKKWKVTKRRIINLVKCGSSYGEAKGLANCKKGYMFVAQSKILKMQ